MRYTRSLISFVILTMLVGLGFLMLSTGHVRAGGDICPMTIEKVADPADDTEFNFSVTGGNIFDDILMDPSKPSFSFNLDSENAPTTVTEEVPPGWILNIECTVPGGGCGGPCLIITEVPNGLTFVCVDNIAGPNTCTFTNVKEPPTNIPTLSGWGLMSLAVVLGILGIVGFMVMRRRKVTA